MKLHHIFSRKLWVFVFNAFKFIAWLLPITEENSWFLLSNHFLLKFQPASTLSARHPRAWVNMFQSPPRTAATAVQEDRWGPKTRRLPIWTLIHVSRRITVSNPRFSWFPRNALLQGPTGACFSGTPSTPWIACRSARDGWAAHPQVRGGHGGSPPRYTLQLPEELSKYNNAYWLRDRT